MNQREFLEQLRMELERARIANISEILADYQEHFSHGLKSGKSEDEIARSLGKASAIAQAYEAERLIQKAQASPEKTPFMAVCQVLGKLLIIAPLNFFLLVIPGSVVFALLVAGWAVSLALISAGFGLLGASSGFGLLSLGIWVALAVVSGSLGVLSLGVLVGMILFLITRFIFQALLQYLQWNLNFVLER